MKSSPVIVFCFLLISLILAACEGSVPTPTLSTGGQPVAIPPVPTKPNSQDSISKTPSPGITPGQTLAAGGWFWSDGSFIQGWYWIRDSQNLTSANWIMKVPSGSGDLILELEVLATDGANGKRGVDAQFYLVFGTPSDPGKAGQSYGQKAVTLKNTSPASDPVGYTCKGTITISRAELKGLTNVWFKASRKDDTNAFGPSTVHVAFNATSVKLSTGAQTTARVADDYWSDGSLISGWNWVRDSALKQSANWLFKSLPPISGDLKFDVFVLATNAAGGGRGVDASFYLYYGSSPGGNREGKFINRTLVKLKNISPSDDPVGYTNKGTITLPGADLKSITNLLLKASRSDDTGGQAAVTVHVAFNRESLQIIR